MNCKAIILLSAVICLTLTVVAFSQDVEIEYTSSILWTDVKDVKTVDTLAYCAFWNGLVILNVSDPASPV